MQARLPRRCRGRAARSGAQRVGDSPTLSSHMPLGQEHLTSAKYGLVPRASPSRTAYQVPRGRMTSERDSDTEIQEVCRFGPPPEACNTLDGPESLCCPALFKGLFGTSDAHTRPQVPRGGTVRKKHEYCSLEVRITYRFVPPSPPPADAAGGESSVVGLKNGSRS